jgi:hypothetical protein
MAVMTSRSDFEKLIALQQAWDGAYYLVGYVVEFALKIRIISELIKSDSFPDRKFVENFYKHDLAQLRKWLVLKMKWKRTLRSFSNGTL